LYRGVGRTPICAVDKSLPWQGKPCPIAAEFFSTTADAYVVLGDIGEEPDADWTADGRPLTVAHAQQRLARQLCADACELAPEDFRSLARAVREIQLREVRECVERVMGRMTRQPSTFIISGSGEFLGREAVERSVGEGQVIGLAQKIGAQASKTAPAHAIAVLTAEFFGGQ
jgi:probable H4MPT-linked C1 transfer pathway protein